LGILWVRPLRLLPSSRVAATLVVATKSGELSVRSDALEGTSAYSSPLNCEFQVRSSLPYMEGKRT